MASNTDENVQACISNEAEVGRATLEQPNLERLIVSISPLFNRLKDAILVFSEDGLLIYCSLETEQIYIPIPSSVFLDYTWTGPKMVILATTDGRSSLMDVFHQTKGDSPKCVSFKVSGTAPCRTVVQTVFYNKQGSSTDVTCYKQLVKCELACYTMMLPNIDPDITICLNKDQFLKLQRVPKSWLSQTRFVLTELGTLHIQSPGGGHMSIKLIPATAENSSGVTTFLPGAHKKFLEEVHYFGKLCEFGVILDTYSGFRSTVQHIKLNNEEKCYLNFYLTSQTPMVGIRVERTASICSYFIAKQMDPVDVENLVVILSQSKPGRTQNAVKRKGSHNNVAKKQKVQNTLWQCGIGADEYCVVPPIDAVGTLDYADQSCESDIQFPED
ncbi:DNA polymerase-associated protein [Cercopithecine alphaherpesvirus 9]|uniref:DNA polymerase processivity factor n=1 Tax=Cercopithecine herpesvirus 9 (strain DHV) TaxID=36348 RepID=Q9E1Z9_CHV9D|nr:DNA polymerase processivity subunit [Cercopithecine alphaherpesvirus 9]AAG27189.1 DNA polymerase-associated protein [Cercopithecine alphaherpesvirus 9]